jgi:hypothetical protein
MIRAVRTRLGILTVLAAGSLALGCGSDGGGNGGAGGGSNKGLPDGEASLAITFSPMYSAFDGKHTFKVPVVVIDAPGKITFRALDTTMVDIQRTGDASAMLRMLKAGKTTIVGEAEDGSWAKAELSVTDTTPDVYDLGKARYENGVEAFATPEGGFMIPDFSDSGIMFVDGGIVFPDGGPRFDAGAFMANPESACTFCHKPDGAGSGGAGLLNIDVEHTPQQIGGYSDDDLLKIFTEGTKPPGVPMRIANTPRLEMTWKMTHKWQMEEEAKKGIIAYIRGLEPKAQGEVDFLGGLLRGDGGFMLPPGLFGDGGFNFGSLFGDGGFMLPPGLFGDSGAPPAPAADTGTPAEPETDAGEAMDAGAGSDSGT